MPSEGAVFADRLRARAPELGWTELSNPSLAAVGASASPRIEVDQMEDLGQAFVVTLPLAGRRVMLFEPWVPFSVRVFLVVRESIRGWRVGGPVSYRSAEVAALCAVFHASGCAKGPGWQQEQIDELLSVDVLAFSTPLSELLLEVREAAPYLCPACVSAEARREAAEEARRIYDRAREERLAGDYIGALMSFAHAGARAEFAQEHELVVWCSIGSAHAQRALGSTHRAEAELTAALDHVKRYDLRAMQCLVHHDQFSFAVERMDVTAALAHGREAVETYPLSHPRLPCFAHDVADFLSLVGENAEALPVIDGVVALPDLPLVDRIIGRGTQARVAGAVGDAERLRRAKAELMRVIMRAPGQEHVARALLDVATGEASLGCAKESCATAEQALEIALNREEVGVAAELRVLLRRIAAGTLTSAPPQPDHARRADAVALSETAARVLSARRAAVAA